MAYPERVSQICEQAAAAFNRKESLDSFWQQTAELYYPERATFAQDKSLGESFASDLYDGSQLIFRRDFCNWLGQALRPKGREWFMPRPRIPEIAEMQATKTYLKSRTQITRSLMYDRLARFNRSNTEADHDWGTFGNSVQTLEGRRDRSGGEEGIFYKTWHLKDCAWLENYFGEIDHMFRRFKISVLDLARMAKRRGWKLSEKVKDKLTLKPQELVSCLHVCMPLDAYDPMIKSKLRQHEWTSLYLDDDNKFEMSNKQVPQFLYIVSRWFTVPGSPYGFSPCVCASIPDARAIQAMTWSILEAGEKAVEPPLVATHEAVRGGVDISAGGITYVDKDYDERTGEALRALDLNLNPGAGDAIRMAIRSNMMEAWYTNKLFLPPTGAQPRTAEEIARINDDFLRTSQAIIEPAESERNGNMLDPTIELTIRLGFWGDIKEMPKELKGQHIDYTYDNPIEDVRRAMKAQNWSKVIQTTLEADQIDPTLKSNTNFKKAYRDTIAAVADPEWLVDEEEAARAAQEAEKELEARGAMEEMGQVGAIAEQAGKANQALNPPPKQLAA